MNDTRLDFIKRVTQVLRTKLGYVPQTVADPADDYVLQKWLRFDAATDEDRFMALIADMDEANVTFRLTWEPDVMKLPDTVTVHLVLDVSYPDETFADWTVREGMEDPVDIALKLVEGGYE